MAEWKPRCLPGQMMEFHCPAWTQLISIPTCDWRNGSAHDRAMFLLSKQQSFEPIFSLWWKITRKILVGFMFYVDNVCLPTCLREFNFYGLVLIQQWEISPFSSRDKAALRHQFRRSIFSDSVLLVFTGILVIRHPSFFCCRVHSLITALGPLTPFSVFSVF